MVGLGGSVPESGGVSLLLGDDRMSRAPPTSNPMITAAPSSPPTIQTAFEIPAGAAAAG